MGYPPQATGAVEAGIAVLETDIGAVQTTVDTVDANIDELLMLVAHVHNIFPEATNLTVTFESPDGAANTWSAWTEIADSGATTLSSMFAATVGHVMDAYVETATGAVIYMMEIAFGAARTVVFRKRFASSGAGVNQTMDQGDAMLGPEIPIGSTIYYRLMAAGAGDDCTVSIHYMVHT